MKLGSWINWPYGWDDLDGWNWISKSEIDHKGKTNVHMDEIFGINEINRTSKLHSKWHWYKNEYHKQKSQYQCCWQDRQWNISHTWSWPNDVITFVDENNHHPCLFMCLGETSYLPTSLLQTYLLKYKLTLIFSYYFLHSLFVCSMTTNMNLFFIVAHELYFGQKD